MKRILYSLAIVSFLYGCGDGETSKKGTQNPVPVTVRPVAAENNMPYVSASGKIEAVNSANLSTRMMGFVEKVHVKVGQKVNKGQLLVSINNADLSAKRAQVNASITEAKAAFNNAEKDYQRFVNLFQENSASQKELDDMTARFEMAKARLEAAQQMKNEVEAQFAYVNLRAPFSGVVTNQFIDEGDLANPGMPLISVEGPKNFEAKVSVPENAISKIQMGDTVQVTVKSNGVALTGVVSEKSTSAKNTGGQFLVTVALDKTQAEILSGMYATVLFPVEKAAEQNTMILVPKTAIVTKGQLSGVYTVSESNTALLRWLRLGKTYGDQVEVLSGLAADESYIVSAEGKLFNGAPISIQ